MAPLLQFSEISISEVRWKTISPNDLITQLQAKDFDYYLDLLLGDVPDTLDKREGSIIYDALAPTAHRLAEQAIDMANLIQQVHKRTATGEFLDLFAEDDGTSREPATYAKVKASVLDENNNVVTSVAIGDRFASVGDEPIFYGVTAINNDGTIILKSESEGTVGNEYIGQILPVTPNDSINQAKIIEISEPARNSEDDETLRSRLLNPISYIAYGGNFSDYKKMLSNIDAVGASQVYPAYKGAGSVKLVILDNNLNPASDSLLSDVKETIDPSQLSGLGFGLAPIGHKVDVVAPTELPISVSIKVSTDNKVSNDVINDSIKKSIGNYFNNLRKSWSKQVNHSYGMTVYRSQVMASVLGLDHVLNAELPKLNGNDDDIVVTFNNETSQLPVLKEVVINE